MTTIGQDEAAQAMAERDPLPQEVTYHVWTADEPAAGLQGERAEVRMVVAEPNYHVRTTLAETFAKVWCEHPKRVRVMPEEPPERTPETVLRAMSAAYLRAAETANVAYYRAPPHDESLCAEATETETDAEQVRGMLYALLAGRDPTNGVSACIVLDYQQRLSGARDMSAPPLEEP